ncbi:MAG TPA: hypothetical protein DCM64_09905 [Gammaproteobacteria bacterium]|jgi:hypothetical protein|nr:hypothetical protein [Gammaproteobacteria bacterium]MDP6731327.1 hypothetical protein [Gammaproteobacteria bacterium]HAJ76755.1 hypothetical protein [Gammaproteobacteria bacterium]|tara:strand:- start:5248 stop:5724 length:477 start_codon:yes stop_codon:yes gene_type:complete
MKIGTKEIVEIIGILAIVLSLLFVASELRLSNTIAIRESREAVVNHFFELSSTRYENPEVAALIAKLKDSTQSLNEEELIRAEGLADTYINLAGLINSSYAAGTLSDEVLEAYMSFFTRVFDELPVLIPYLEGGFSGGSGAGYVFDRLAQEAGQRSIQ